MRYLGGGDGALPWPIAEVTACPQFRTAIAKKTVVGLEA